MTRFFEVTGWSKFAEEDIFRDGCQPDTTTCNRGDETWFDESLGGLIDQLQAFVGSTSVDDLLKDSCEEIGRLDIQVYETADGLTATLADVREWKAGNRRLWLVCYTFHIERVTREPVSLA